MMAFEYSDILAGPIVRRVEPQLAAVWVALRKPAQITLKLWEDIQNGNSPPASPQFSSELTPTRPIGVNLHLALVKVVLSDPDRLRSDQVYSYDLMIKDLSDDVEKDFYALDLLKKHKPDGKSHLPLGYAEDMLPGFALPPTNIENLKIIEGSCRLPHSAGKDAMPLIDDFLSKNNAYLDPLKRPHQLFLTGDQIYSDEMDPDLVELINQVGNELLSGSPTTVVDRLSIDHEGTVYQIPATTSFFPPSRRQRLVTKMGQLTTVAGGSHVLSFGEYCGIYLLGWSNVLWPSNFLTDKLNQRWQRVQTYKSSRERVYNTLIPLIEKEDLTDDQASTAKAKLNAFHAWQLLPPDWRKIDHYLTTEQKLKDWGDEDIGGFVIEAPPNTTSDLAPDDIDLQLPSEIDSSLHEPILRSLAGSYSPSWYIGDFEMGFDKIQDEKPKGENKYVSQLYRDKSLHRLRGIQDYFEGLAKVRRILANIPTYMTFDDHDVTDDWNMTQGWIDAVNAAPLGRAVLRNGLLCFGLFQAWGNDPLYFEPASTADTPGEEMLDRASQLFFDDQGNPRTSGPDAASYEQFDLLFNLGGLATPPEQRVKWHYRVGGHGYEVISLDLRTYRGFRSNNGPPELLTRSALSDQVLANPEFSYGPPPAGTGITFVIASLPVLGFPPVEYILQPVINTIDRIKLPHMGIFQEAERDYFVGPFEHDPEPWSYHEDILEALLGRLSTYGRVIFLSGEVHYTCVMKLDYWRFDGGQDNATHTRFVQLTGSSFKNFAEGPRGAIFQSGFLSRLAQQLGIPQERMAWERNGRDEPLVPPSGVPFNQRIQRQLENNTCLIPLPALPEGTRQRYDPNWYWHMALLRDGRDDSQRLSGVSNLPNLPEPVTNAQFKFSDIVSIGQRHFWQAQHGPPRAVLFETNVGQITIQPESGSHKVVYSVTHRLRELPDDKPKAYTIFDVPLNDEGQVPPQLPIAP